MQPSRSVPAHQRAANSDLALLAEHGKCRSVTTLAEQGFLADEVAGVVVAVRQKYAPWLAEIRAVNALLVRSQHELAVHQESAQEMTCATLYVRSLAHAQAAVLLLERGMAASARAMIRCALEGLFNLGACACDAKIALSFIDADQVEQKRRARYLGEVQDAQARSLLDGQELQAIREQAECKIKEFNARELKARDMAKLAGLEDLYLMAYPLFSGAVHSSVRDLNAHIELDATGNVSALVTGPVLKDLDQLYLVIGDTMFNMVKAIAPVFKLSVLEECEAHIKVLRQLGAPANH